jgi:hypothetical protein
MAHVDFAPWELSEEDAAAVAYQARRLPAAWRITCTLGSHPHGLFDVFVFDGEGGQVARFGPFKYGRFGDVARVLQGLVPTGQEQAEAT